MKQISLVVAFFLITALLSACATKPMTSSSKDRATTLRIDNADIKVWAIEGKVGLKHKNKAQSAYLSWQHDQPDYKIEVFGPFGRGRISIEKQAGEVTLADGEQEWVAESGRELLLQTTGFLLPIERLEWWVRGLPAPDSKILATTFDELGRLQSFRQQDWQVSFLKMAVVDGYELPTKLRLNHPDFGVTVVIKSWQLGEMADESR